MNWNKIEILNDNCEKVEAQAPIIISASRSTDIPAFYSDWFVKRWEKGYVKWKNPFNGKYLYVSFKNARAVVFWSKNPKPMLKHLEFIKKNIKNFYFQFTLNDYDAEGFEGTVPKLDKRIETFKEISNKIGKERVIWRFDPLILTDKIDVSELLSRIEYIGTQLKDYTDKLVFSFADIKTYNKVQNNLKKEKIIYKEFTQNDMISFAQGLNEKNIKLGLQIATCAENIALEKYNIFHNKCIDDDLLIKLFNSDSELMNFLGVEIQQPDLFSDIKTITKKKNLKDKGQRELCGCIQSKDIGQYNTCPHECVYCYANTSKQIAKDNFNCHKLNPDSDTIIGV
jgi:DNA repair photolyase